MHGIKRSHLSKLDEEKRRTEETGKIKEYQALVQDCLDKKRKRDYSQAALAVTNQILDINPEFYTIWNYRRLILQQGIFPISTPAERFQALQADVRLTTAYLKVYPKVYWIWIHRKWCLDNIPAGPGGLSEEEGGEEGGDVVGWRNIAWMMELGLVEKMLSVDARNFHVWNYRRHVLSSLPPSFAPAQNASTELKYTTKKIEANFSNFSAWHQRTKVLPALWDKLEGPERAKGKEREFELVTQALWTDPGDQSGWLYHRWLIGDGSDVEVLKREIESIKSLLEAEPDSKWPLESLVHYSSLLITQSSTTQPEKDTLKTEILGWLKDLERIDPFRKERYLELAAEIQ